MKSGASAPPASKRNGPGVQVLFLVVCLFLGSALQAQPSRLTPAELDRLTAEVASHLRCPVCQGLSIQDSPSELSLEMKALVRDQLAAGKSPEEVRSYFVEKYGEWVLLEPEPAGWNLLVYLLPVLGMVGGGVLIVRAVKRWTSVPETRSAD